MTTAKQLPAATREEVIIKIIQQRKTQGTGRKKNMMKMNMMKMNMTRMSMMMMMTMTLKGRMTKMNTMKMRKMMKIMTKRRKMRKMMKDMEAGALPALRAAEVLVAEVPGEGLQLWIRRNREE